MRRRRAAVVALLALACLAAGTDAASGSSFLRGRRLIRIELEGSSGYSILIVSDRKRHLVLTTTKDGFTTEYATHNELTGPTRLKVTLPHLGSVAVRFHASGPPRRLPALAGCAGPRPMVREGVVRGAIEFVGERRYTQVEAREAPAEIEEWKSQSCRRSANPEPSSPDLTDWTSKFSASELGVEFLARKYRPGLLEDGNGVLYSAETAEAASEWASLIVYRRALAFAPASAFVDAHPEHMTMSPPPPFTGAATLARTPESVFAWEGDLSIQFPGLDPLPLADPHFELDYCRRKVGCFRQRIPHWLSGL